MKTTLISKRLALVLTCGLLLACTGGDEKRDEKTTDSPATTAPPSAPQPATAETDTLSDQPATTAQPTDASGQNFTFAGSNNDLQIVGSENQYDILLPTDVLFDFDKANLRPEGLALLQKVKQHFATHGVDQLHVWGHTDSKGNDQYNFKLSQRRAIAVADWLKRNVKTKGLIMSLGRGEQEPLVPNENSDGSDNPVNRQKNRRVTLSVIKYPDAKKMLDEAKKQAAQ